MAKFVKVILFLLLTVTLHGVASNVFTEKPVEQSELAITYSMKQHEQISAPDFPYAPVADISDTYSACTAWRVFHYFKEPTAMLRRP